MAAQTLGRYEILQQLGSSDLVAVFKAQDPRADRTVVLRAMPLDASEPQAAERLARFREEAARAATLESPNIVELYETGEADGVFYAAMEFVSGSRLPDLQKPLSNSDLLDISRQVCTAFDHAHSHGVIAANIKPANFMVEWDGALKLMDFGISESTGRDSHDAVAYLSPEQVNGEAPGVRSNLFSWAAILYELATGQRAFAGKGNEVRRAIVEDQPAPPTELNPELAEGISQVIMKGLAKSPAERYASGAEMLRDLENYKSAGRAPSPPLPFMLQTHKQAGAPMAAALESTRPSPRVAAAKVAPPQSAPVQPPPMATAPAPPRTAAVAVDSHAAPAPPSAASVSDRSPRPLEPMGAFATAEPQNTKREPSAGSPVPSTASQASVPRPPVRPVTNSPVTRPAARTARPAPQSTPVAANNNLWSNMNTRLLFYAMAAVIVALLAVIVFGAVSSHNNKVAAVPQPIAPNDPDFSQPTGAPQPVPLPATQNTFEITPDAAKPQRHARKAMVVAAKAPMTGEVQIQTLPSGAQVQLDGRSDLSWVTPCVISGVQPGQHAVVLSKPGYAPVSRAFQVLAGNRAMVSLGLQEVGASLAITSNPPGATILVDGRNLGRVTPAQIIVSGGTHKVAVEKPGYLPASATTAVAPGQVFRFDPQLKVTGDPEEARSAGKMTKLFGKGTPEGMGRLQVRTSPKGAWITLNNHILDRATPADFFLPPGSYEMKLTLTGYKDVEKVITIERDSKLVVEEILQP